MFKFIEITLHLNVKNEEKGERVLARFRELFERPMSIQSFGRNPDDDSMFRVDLITPLETDNIEHAIFETLKACTTFATSWTVFGPDKYEDGRWEFSGLARDGQVTIPGIRAAGFEITSYEE